MAACARAQGSIPTYHRFTGYEQSGRAVTKHYSFGGVPVAVRTGSSIFYGVEVNSLVISSTANVGNGTACPPRVAR